MQRRGVAPASGTFAEKIREAVRQAPDATLDAYRSRFALPIARYPGEGLDRARTDAKKKSQRAGAQDRPAVKRQRDAWKAEPAPAESAFDP